MNVWDTPGGDQFAHMRDLDYEGADACIMVYCIDKESTFKEMQGLKELASGFCNPLFFLVGNKVDLDAAGERLVDKARGRELKDDLELTHFVETNANAADLGTIKKQPPARIAFAWCVLAHRTLPLSLSYLT